MSEAISDIVTCHLHYAELGSFQITIAMVPSEECCFEATNSGHSPNWCSGDFRGTSIQLKMTVFRFRVPKKGARGTGKGAKPCRTVWELVLGALPSCSPAGVTAVHRWHLGAHVTKCQDVKTGLAEAREAKCWCANSRPWINGKYILHHVFKAKKWTDFQLQFEILAYKIYLVGIGPDSTL